MAIEQRLQCLRLIETSDTQIDSHAVIAGPGHHLEGLLDRSFLAVGAAQFHRPERLEDLKLGHEDQAAARSLPDTIQGSSSG